MYNLNITLMIPESVLLLTGYGARVIFSSHLYLSNAALARTSFANTTVLSYTSGLFTLFIGVLMGQDTVNVSKVVAVLVSMAGVAMTTLGKTWAADDSQLSAS
ncbi:hypothetical protein TSUD_135430 [Trifolium subterraneum]|uniref:Uncharacterized protein n=1 Tax=Trifolium subterraneum TaxID=3900 RepID=A0A2Z6NHK3_TRISU|nr:hypothetical protein TSUD_135430 [Trifolium subterraneum]